MKNPDAPVLALMLRCLTGACKAPRSPRPAPRSAAPSAARSSTAGPVQALRRDARARSRSTSPCARGEVYGYLGPNGAGKTTTIRLLLGLHRPSAGRASCSGSTPGATPSRAHRRVAYVAGEPFLWPALTSAETFEFLARLRGGTDVAYRDVLVERFQLDAAKKVRALSKGNRQKVQLDRRASPRAPSCCSSTSPPAASTR